MRSMFFSSNDVLAALPAPVVVAAPQIAATIPVVVAKLDAGRKPTLVVETRAKLRQLFPSGRGPRDSYKALALQLNVSVSTIKRALENSD